MLGVLPFLIGQGVDKPRVGDIYCTESGQLCRWKSRSSIVFDGNVQLAARFLVKS